MDAAVEFAGSDYMRGERKGQPSREGLVSFTFWTDPELRLSVRRLSLDTGKSVQELMEEATRNLLADYAKRSKRKG